MDDIKGIISDSLNEIGYRVVKFIPNIIVMFLVILTGVVLSFTIRYLLRKGLAVVNFDGMMERTGIRESLAKIGLKADPSLMVSSAAYWAILYIFFVLGFVALDIAPINSFIVKVLSYIPNFIAAVVIIIVGFVLANIIEKAVISAASDADIAHADSIGWLARALIMLMTASMSFEQLGIARGVIIAAFSILFGGIVLAISIAFGFGGREIARKFLEERLKRKDRETSGNPE